MRYLIATLLGWKLVWLQDMPICANETVLRLARQTPYGLRAYRTSRVFRIAPCILKDDGTVAGACYVASWKYANGFAP